MRDIAAEIAQYLRADGFAAYADSLPDEPEEAAAVYEDPAERGAAEFGGVGANYPRSVRLRVRAGGRERAFELAQRAFALLSGESYETPVPLSGGAAFLLPQQTPAIHERDNKGRAVFAWSLTAAFSAGLRRLTIARLVSDTEALLRYDAPVQLARAAVSVTRGQEAAGSRFYDTSGGLVHMGGGAMEELTLRLIAPDEAALALILGAERDEKGVYVKGNCKSQYFAIGYEACADALGGYEKTWFYKCRARLGQYERAGKGAGAACAELIVMPLATLYRYRGEALTMAYLTCGAPEMGAGWFDAVYVPGGV